jgi:hypothetical protein
MLRHIRHDHLNTVGGDPSPAAREEIRDRQPDVSDNDIFLDLAADLLPVGRSHLQDISPPPRCRRAAAWGFADLGKIPAERR